MIDEPDGLILDLGEQFALLGWRRSNARQNTIDDREIVLTFPVEGSRPGILLLRVSRRSYANQQIAPLALRLSISQDRYWSFSAGQDRAHVERGRSEPAAAVVIDLHRENRALGEMMVGRMHRFVHAHDHIASGTL